MALTESDIEEFIALVQHNAELRERVRRALIEDNLERLSASLAQMAEDDRIFRAEMRAFQGDTIQRLNRLEGENGNIRGALLELKFKVDPVRLTQHFRSVRPVALGDYEPVALARDNFAIADDDWRDLTLADSFALVRKRGQSQDVVAVVEISQVVDRNDVERARRRAAILAAAGIPSVACAVGAAATKGAMDSAGDDVVLIVDRRDLVDSPTA